MPERQKKFINLRTAIALTAYGEDGEASGQCTRVPALEFSSRCVNKLVRDLVAKCLQAILYCWMHLA
jgi:hypothetical protein